MWKLDARIPVFVGSPPHDDGGSAFLAEGDQPIPAGAPMARFLPADGRHDAGCACCTARGSAALGLDALFLARARGEVGLFPSVVALAETAAGRAAVLAALAADPVVSARFRLAP